MSIVVKLNANQARLDPEAVFSDPSQVIAASGLTRGQKIATLDRWKQMLLERMRATTEGMAPVAGGTAEEAATVERISKALRALQEELQDEAPARPEV